MYPQTEFEKFAEYLIYFPEEDSPEFDGIHYGGIKGISEKAPESAKTAYAAYMLKLETARKLGHKI